MADQIVKDFLGNLPTLGEGKKLFDGLEQNRQEENISPWLANALHRFMVAAEQHKPGQLHGISF